MHRKIPGRQSKGMIFVTGATGDIGERLFNDSRRIILEAQPEEIWPAVASIGGEVGYYYADWLWKIRGLIDQLCGGVGLSRGRRSATELYPGDTIDFWRVATVNEFDVLTLSAVMKLPGKADLTFRLQKLENGQSELQLTACFLPRGLAGLLYWYAVMPFHHFVFNGMLRGIAKAAGKKICRGPEKFSGLAPGEETLRKNS
ncbi:MAG: DUF2867 domain-containing protein [Chloroflexi bacterium]|nr:DUF2867 domain-containing protein [Chloroflexota bacterium]